MIPSLLVMMMYALLSVCPLQGAVAERNSLESWHLCSAREKHVVMLYYTSSCPYSQKVLQYLDEMNKTVPMKNLEYDSQAKEELKRIGGKMQVPCLIVNGQAIYNANAIIDWLSEHESELIVK